jgi:hypothetical protein
MFKKPLAHQSNATPLRSSARRQLLSSIFRQFPDLLPATEDDEPDVVSEKELGKLILPEGIRSAAIETSGGVEGVCTGNQVGELTQDAVPFVRGGTYVDDLWAELEGAHTDTQVQAVGLT